MLNILHSFPFITLFSLKKFDVYYKRVMKGDEWRMCRMASFFFGSLENIASIDRCGEYGNL